VVFTKKLSLSLLILFGILFLLRLPSLFEPYWYGDEGIYLTLGLALRKGLVFYRDIHDNKPPLLYIIAAIAGSQFWFRFILLVWNGFNVYLIYKFAKKIFIKEIFAFFAGIIFIILSLVLEGNIANGEIFMIMPVTLAMLVLLKPLKLKNYFLAGILFSLGFLFKVPAVMSAVAAGIYLLFFNFKNIKNIISLIIGFLLLPMLTYIYYSFHGAGKIFLVAAFSQNTAYVSSWGGSWGGSLFSLHSGLMQRGLILVIFLLILFIFRKKIKPVLSLLIIWFFCDLFGALLSARPYPHYLIQIVPSLSLLLVYAIFSKKFLEKVAVVLVISVLAFSFIVFKFWRYPIFSYYQNFWEFSLGKKSQNAYYSFFDKRVPSTYKISAWIKLLSKPEDRIYIWGDEPFIYALSERLPPGRFTVSYHVVDFKGWDEEMNAINHNKPRIIVVFPGRKFEALSVLISKDYVTITTVENAKLYLRL